MRRNVHAGVHRACGADVDLFTEGELEQIHLASLEVLWGTGVHVEDEQARSIYAAGGCRVDDGLAIVRIPSHVVEESLRLAPPSLTLHGRNPANDVVLEPRRIAFLNFGEGLMVVDPWKSVRRLAAIEDVGHIARLVDALDSLDVNEISVHPQDVPGETMTIHTTEQQFLNTTKPIGTGPITKAEAETIIDMAATVAGGRERLRDRPLIYMAACPVSPLKLPRGVTDVIVLAARAGIPDNICSIVMAGGSAPASLAGSLVLHNAEVLAGITLAQLAKQGAPVIYGSSSTILDLRYGSAAVGCPETGLLNAAVAIIARQYRLPSYVAGA